MKQTIHNENKQIPGIKMDMKINMDCSELTFFSMKLKRQCVSIDTGAPCKDSIFLVIKIDPMPTDKNKVPLLRQND